MLRVKGKRMDLFFEMTLQLWYAPNGWGPMSRRQKIHTMWDPGFASPRCPEALLGTEKIFWEYKSLWFAVVPRWFWVFDIFLLFLILICAGLGDKSPYLHDIRDVIDTAGPARQASSPPRPRMVTQTRKAPCNRLLSTNQRLAPYFNVNTLHEPAKV